MRRTPKKPMNEDKQILNVSDSPRNIQARKTTSIGEIKINEIASPRGNITTAKNQVQLHRNPRIPLK